MDKLITQQDFQRRKYCKSNGYNNVYDKTIIEKNIKNPFGNIYVF